MKTHNGDIFGGFQALRFRMSTKNLVCDRVIPSMVPILHILMRQLIVHRFFMPIWTLRSTVTVSFGKERTNMWSVPLIKRICPRKSFQHLLPSIRTLTNIQPRASITSILLHFTFHDLRIIFTIDIRGWSFIFETESSISDLCW